MACTLLDILLQKRPNHFRKESNLNQFSKFLFVHGMAVHGNAMPANNTVYVHFYSIFNTYLHMHLSGVYPF